MFNSAGLKCFDLAYLNIIAVDDCDVTIMSKNMGIMVTSTTVSSRMCVSWWCYIITGTGIHTTGTIGEHNEVGGEKYRGA